MSETRERIYYVIDSYNNENLLKRLTFDEAYSDAEKLNKKEGQKRYYAKGSWAIHINRG